MPRKRPAPSELALTTPRSRVTRRSNASSAPSSKRKHSPDPTSDQDSDEEPQPSTSKKSAKKQVPRGKTVNKHSKKSSQMKEESDDDDDEDEDGSSREPTPKPVSNKKSSKTVASAKKKKKRGTPPDTPSTLSPTPSRSPSPEPEAPPPAPKSTKKGKTAPKKKKEPEQPSPSPSKPVKNAPKRKKKAREEEEEESPEEKKLRRRAERKARRLKEAKNRPKLTLEEKLEKLRKKKERKERRRQSEKEESMRQKYGQRKMKPVASKWNFGPISSINQRRRDEMMAFFPKASFTSSEDGKPAVMNNFRRATVKYNMEVLNPFITCGVCDGYIVDATTIIDCMHTFCKSCLLGYFESDNNSCPTCGTFIHGSHPLHYVTYDRAVNELVNQFVPKLEKEELEMRKKFLRDCREALGIDTVAEDREKRERLERERVTGTNRCYAEEPPRYSHHRDDCQVTVKLLPGTPNLPLVARPFIVCSEMTTMNTLKKYLALQIWDDQNRYSELDMFCDGQLMGKDFSIRFVWMMKRRGQPKAEPLIIRYHMIRN
uniref:RING-type domain-containing protein n=1 Tax=Caenorhabditis japonica TaxID=281687 RepID=A0A8R1I009_CAEJA